MLVLRCTVKMLKLLDLRTADVSADVGATKPWLEWYANLLWMERRKCVLFTNASTLYSFLVTDVRKASLKRLGDLFDKHLAITMVVNGASEQEVKRVLAETTPVTFAKTIDRSVLGSMNDLASQVGYRVAAYGGLDEVDAIDLYRDLNRIPMSALGYSYAVDLWQNCVSQTAT